MVDWQSPAELAHDAESFTKFMHALLGLYIWEWVVSLDFDLAFLIGKRKFRWPMIFYFIGRYSLLAALVGIAIALNVTQEVDCQALYTFNQCMGNFAIGMASINLSIRTMAIWSQKWYIIWPLVGIILGHWSLLLHGVLLKAAWIEGQGCVITSTDSKLLSATFIYSMIFDFIVMCLTAWKLAFPEGGRSKLVEMIFSDGLVYFLIAFLSNTIAVIFLSLNLNAVLSVIADVPAATASTIVACRVVRRLSNYTSKGAELFTSTQGSHRTGTRPAPPNVSVIKNGTGVHVQMDTFAVSSEVGYGASGRTLKEGAFDPEAQHASEEFKHPPY